jgi:DNA-directed RNA polymerase subunit B
MPVLSSNRLYEGEAEQYLGGMRDTFEVPSAESNIRGYRGEKFYRLLEGDGVVAHESQVSGGDVVIGRTSRLGSWRNTRNLRSGAI